MYTYIIHIYCRIYYIVFMRLFENTYMFLSCYHTYLVIMTQSYLQGTKFGSVSTQVRICLDLSTHDMTLSKILWHLAVATNFFSVRGTEDDSSKLQVPRWELLCLCIFSCVFSSFFLRKVRGKIIWKQTCLHLTGSTNPVEFRIGAKSGVVTLPQVIFFRNFGCSDFLEFC